MKKRTTRLLAAAVSVLMGASACNQSDELPVAGALPEIRISATIGEQTRLEYDGAETSFTVGDRIMIYGWLGQGAAVPDVPPFEAVNTLTSFTGVVGQNWTTDSTMYWMHPKIHHNFLGIYPSHVVKNFEADPYVLDEYDQAASDLMTASLLGRTLTSSDGSPVTTNLAFYFAHAMAKFQLNLSFGDDIAKPANVTGARLYCAREATVNYRSMKELNNALYSVPTVNAPAYVYDAARFVYLPPTESGSTESFASVVIPQAGVTCVEVDVNGKTYRYEHGTDIQLEQNKITTLELFVGKEAIISASTFVLVQDWGEETITVADDPEEVLPYTSPAAGTIAKNPDLIAENMLGGTLRIAGPLYEDDLEAIGKFGWKNNTLVTLDLSGVKGVTKIPDFMFSEGGNSCTSLERVILPSSITTIGSWAFYGCKALKDINLSHITEVGEAAFSASALTEVSLDAAINIRNGAFERCAGLTTISLPLATTLESSAFAGSTALTRVYLPSATTLEVGLFSGCAALQEIVLTAQAFEKVMAFKKGAVFNQHPFVDIPHPGNVTLTLNASQQGNVDESKHWRPKKSGGNSALFNPYQQLESLQSIDLSGFNIIYR